MKKLIEKYLTTGGLDIRCFDRIDSTNTQLRKLAEQGAAEGTVVIAAEQTAGKGRRGRSFYSPQGTGLYISILLRPALSPEKSLYITSCAAAAAALTLEELSGESAGIKWVNDIYMRGRKVCGILTEGSITEQGMNYAIPGIGVNLLPPEGGFPAELEQLAGAAFACGDADELRARTAAGILDRFMQWYARLEEKPFFEDYRSRSILTGETVNVFKNLSGEPERAKVLGIDGDFALLVRYDSGEEAALNTGEVTIRKI